jgi:hypothetical protein
MAPKPSGKGWKQALTRVIPIRGGGDLKTLLDASEYLLDASEYLLSLPEAEQGWNSWQRAAGLLVEAAKGGDVEAATFQIERAALMALIRIPAD